MTTYQYLIGVDELRLQLDHAKLRVVDCRFDLTEPAAGHEEYDQGHIPGAQYANLDLDLAGPVSDTTGRHPLPSAQAFADRLGAWGIDDRSQVVVYDHADGAIAARLWWMLRWVGHQQVAVLNGGFAAWRQAAYAVSDRDETVSVSRFRPEPNNGLIVNTDEIADLVATGQGPPIVDARASPRFAGESEPIDLVAGHVPGAVNHPFSACVNPSGRLKNRHELRAGWCQILGADLDRQWIAMCGSGVTACHLALSAGLAGYTQPRLYVGSWSEWIRDPRRPVATGAQSAADLR